MSRKHMLEHLDNVWRGRFTAMDCPCEVLVRDADHASAKAAVEMVTAEAWRVEQRFSRDRNDNLVYRVNNSSGQWVQVDEEFDRLLDFAHTCYRVSEGKLDISAGVLWRAWQSGGVDLEPEQSQLEALLEQVGLARLERQPGEVRLPAGMEIDFDGISQQYAVDRSLQLARRVHGGAIMVKFGTDLACWSPGTSWQLDLGDLSAGALSGTVDMVRGALSARGESGNREATGGAPARPVLDPHTGRPVTGAPWAVTVAADHCIQAGMLSRLALLHGAEAGSFLEQQGVRYWLAATAA